MREVKFEQIGMKNFCCYIDEMKLDFSSDKIVLLTGPNGVGKSTIFDCLPYTLYGVNSKGAHGDDVVNDIVGKDCYTWLDFKVDDVRYRLDRYHKHHRYGNTVFLKRNGIDIKKGQREVLPEIERLLVPQKLFMNTLLFGQKVKNFFTDLTDTEKKEIFRKVLLLDDYVLYYNETSERLKKILKEIIDTDSLISIKNQLRDDAKFQVTLLKEAKREFEKNKMNEVSIYELKLEELRERFETATKEIKLLREQASGVEEITLEINKVGQEILISDSNLGTLFQEINTKKQLRIAELQNKLLKSNEEVDTKCILLHDKIKEEFDSEKERISQEVFNLGNQKNQLENQVVAIELRIDSIKDENAELKENIIDKEVATCPTCHQTIGPETFQNLRNVMEENNKRILLAEDELVETREKVSSIGIQYNELGDEVQKNMDKRDKNLNALNNEKRVEFQKVRSRFDELSDQIEKSSKEQLDKMTKETIERTTSLKDRKQKLEMELNNKKQKLEIIKERENYVLQTSSQVRTTEELLSHKREEEYDDTQLKSYVEKIVTFDVGIKGLGENKERLEEAVKVLEFWKVGFSSSGIPSLLIDEAIPFMNKQVSYYLDRISNGRYLVSFDTLKATKEGEFRDKISVNVLDNLTKANSRVKLSGGQTRLVDIATILTLCDLQSSVQDVKFNIVLFDEIFDSLDDENIGYVSNLLRSLIVDKSVNIISHRHIDQIEADEVLSFF